MKRYTTGILAALTVLTMGALVAPDVLAEDAATSDRSSAAESAEASRNRAADAHVEAVAEAAVDLVSATKLDLDIRLVSHTSVQVASDVR